ncbi:MAG: hypothetical protein JKY81_10265 [Colwellia sp.]|nr:hypothetical protein [Colwellia sp.]
MQISNSFSSPLTSGLTTEANKGNIQVNKPVRTAESELVAKGEREQPSSKQAQPSIVIDEQAIALFKESQAILSTQTKTSSGSANQDRPLAKNETAVASYQAVSNLAQRESVQQLFGVDLFA